MTDMLVIAHGRLQGAGARKFDGALARLRELLGHGVEAAFTAGPGDATRLAREALGRGIGWIAAVGGDGTIHEVLNGFFDGERNVQPRSCLSFLPCGNGNDWARTIGYPLDLAQAVERLGQAHTHSVDIGLARYRGRSGRMEERVFLNFAETGVGAVLVGRRAARAARLRGWAGYWPAAILTALSFRPRPMQLVIDGRTPLAMGPLLSLIVAGGRYIGAGMHCAPMARPDDGLLELLTIGNFGRMEILWKIPRFISGRYLEESKVTHRSVRSVEVIAGESMPFELDGEWVGSLPASIRVVPRALRVRT